MAPPSRSVVLVKLVVARMASSVNSGWMLPVVDRTDVSKRTNVPDGDLSHKLTSSDCAALSLTSMVKLSMRWVLVAFEIVTGNAEYVLVSDVLQSPVVMTLLGELV